jgi:hypothetical protein
VATGLLLVCSHPQRPQCHLPTNRPGVAVAGNGSQYVYWKGTDNNLWEAFYDGRWNGPLNLNMGPLG